MTQIIGRTYIWVTLKLVNLFKNIYLQSSLSLVTTVSPSVNVQSGAPKALKSIHNFNAFVLFIVLVRLTGTFWQIFWHYVVQWVKTLQMGRFSVQTSLCIQQSLGSQPGYKVLNDLLVEFLTWVINIRREERGCLVVSGTKLAFGQPNEQLKNGTRCWFSYSLQMKFFANQKCFSKQKFLILVFLRYPQKSVSSIY